MVHEEAVKSVVQVLEDSLPSLRIAEATCLVQVFEGHVTTICVFAVKKGPGKITGKGST